MQPWIALQFTAGEYSSGNLLSLMKGIIEAGEEKKSKKPLSPLAGPVIKRKWKSEVQSRQWRIYTKF